MIDIIDSLHSCILFKNFKTYDIEAVLKQINFNISSFSKDETIAIEDDECLKLGIIIKGEIEIKKLFESGKSITIDKLNKGNIFGEVIIFSNIHKYPSTIVSTNNTEVMFISKENIIKLCSTNPIILNNFMGLLSNKILMLNKKLKNLSYQTIEQKISNYLLEEHKKQNSLILNLSCTRKEMAEILGIPRPSLSRQLINMKNNNIIDFYKNTIKILSLDLLEESLF